MVSWHSHTLLMALTLAAGGRGEPRVPPPPSPPSTAQLISRAEQTVQCVSSVRLGRVPGLGMSRDDDNGDKLRERYNTITKPPSLVVRHSHLTSLTAGKVQTSSCLAAILNIA